jgi:hypothetical protein
MIPDSTTHDPALRQQVWFSIGFSSIRGRKAMVLKVDEIEPNIFPAIHSTDVELKPDHQVEIVLITLIEGRAVRVRVRLDKTKAETLVVQLNETLGELT